MSNAPSAIMIRKPSGMDTKSRFQLMTRTNLFLFPRNQRAPGELTLLSLFIKRRSDQRCQEIFNQLPAKHDREHVGRNHAQRGGDDVAINDNAEPREQAGDDCRLRTRAEPRSDRGIAKNHDNAEDEGDDHGYHKKTVPWHWETASLKELTHLSG